MTIKQGKIGIFSDIHLGLCQDSKTWHDISLNFAKWASEELYSRGIQTIIIPGDVFHNRTEIGVDTLSVSKKFFDYFKNFELIISSGNHDCFLKQESSINSISILNGWENITVVDGDPLVLKRNKKTISVIPWGVNIKDIPNTDICFGHFEINTFYMNTYKVCEHGMDSKNILEKAPIVFSGHFHGKEHRRYDKGEIIYVGSPHQHNFGDENQQRGIYVYDIDTNDLEFIENTVSPKHIKIFLNKIQKEEQSVEFLQKNVPDNLICFIVNTEISENDLESLISKIKSLNPKTFRLDYESKSEKLIENSDNHDYNMVNIEQNIADFVGSTDFTHKDSVVKYLTDLYNQIRK
jgi:DNA repair exonuclease SbcCD nuclease subunit